MKRKIIVQYGCPVCGKHSLNLNEIRQCLRIHVEDGTIEASEVDDCPHTVQDIEDVNGQYYMRCQTCGGLILAIDW